MKVSNRYRSKTAEMYKRFSRDCFDFSETSLTEMYLHDSYGSPAINIESTSNGFFIGKFWMSITINLWKEDIKDKLLTKEELLNDFPEWFIKKVFNDS